MNPVDFLKTIYLGDRYCTKFIIDDKSRNIELHINCISRVRDLSGHWNYYNDENIDNGIIMFEDYDNFDTQPQGLIPNEEICDIAVQSILDKKYKFVISACNINEEANCKYIMISFEARRVCLIDPLKPDLKILI